ncbi:MAG: SulP family inorganic anion transporter [Thiolinea sp.]
MTSAIGMLIFSSGFALSTQTRINIDKDLQVTGFANILAGLVAGWPGYLSLALSSINAKQGKQLPLTGLLSAFFSSMLLYFSTHLLVFIPRFVICSVLAYIGFSFLSSWVFSPLKNLPLTEKVVLLLVVSIVVVFGLFEGIAAGLVVSALLSVLKHYQLMRRSTVH